MSFRNQLYIFFCCCLLSCNKKPGNASQPINSTIASLLATSWLGFGYNQDPLDRDNAGQDVDVWDNAHWDLTVNRVNYMKPGLVRINLYRSWFNPSGVVGVYDWNSPKMLSVYKVLDYYKAQNIPVMTGLWQSTLDHNDKSPFYTSTGVNGFPELQADMFRQLFVTKGYDNIRWYTPTNEPKGMGMDFPTWSLMMQNTFQGFSGAGLPTNRFCGADSWDEWTVSAATFNKTELSGYDHHYYLNSGSYELISGNLEKYFRDQVTQIRNIDNTNKPVFLSEAGFMSVTDQGGLDYWFTNNPVATVNPTTAQYALQAFDYGIQVARSGESAALAWSLDGYDYGKDPGMWNIAGTNGGTKLRPWYYSWSLLCKYFPAGGIIYPINFTSASVRGVALEQKVQDKSHWSFAFINWGDKQVETNFSVPLFKGGSFSKIVISLNAVGDGSSLSLPKESLSVNSLNDGFLVQIPPTAAVFITSMDNAPIGK